MSIKFMHTFLNLRFIEHKIIKFKQNKRNKLNKN